MILITKTFYKALEKMKSVQQGDMIREIRKHQSGLNNFIEIGEISETPVLKGYLNSKKVRIVLLFQYKKGLYFPFYIVRKETKQGYNISKQSITFLEQELEKHFQDLDNGDFEKIEL